PLFAVPLTDLQRHIRLQPKPSLFPYTTLFRSRSNQRLRLTLRRPPIRPLSSRKFPLRQNRKPSLKRRCAAHDDAKNGAFGGQWASLAGLFAHSSSSSRRQD